MSSDGEGTWYLGLLHVTGSPRREGLLSEWCWGNQGDGGGGGGEK